VYAAVAAAPPETFAGAISLGFCPDLEITKPPCQQNGLTVTRRKNGLGFDLASNHQIRTPWMVSQGDSDQVCAPAVTQAFVNAIPGAKLFSLPKVGHGFGVTRNWEPQYLAAYDAIVAQRAKSEPVAIAPEVRDLSLTEVMVPPSTRTDTMAIILTGDGGWAALDKSLAAGLAARGVPSVGWSSLRYYWTDAGWRSGGSGPHSPTLHVGMGTEAGHLGRLFVWRRCVAVPRQPAACILAVTRTFSGPARTLRPICQADEQAERVIEDELISRRATSRALQQCTNPQRR
jgi:hypothetical protein